VAAAKDVVGGDKQALTWLEVLDTDGATWKYHQGAPAPANATIHLYHHQNARIEIMPDGAGGVLLRQAGPGLPRSINVRLAPRPAPGAGLGVVGGWGGGVFTYEQP
jgi:hypothetical protein